MPSPSKNISEARVRPLECCEVADIRQPCVALVRRVGQSVCLGILTRQNPPTEIEVGGLAGRHSIRQEMCRKMSLVWHETNAPG